MESILKEKQIDWLLHFTRVVNLPNILKYGLLPRTTLEEKDIETSVNDDFRHDKCKNAICMSVEFPNYKMFYPLRLENPGVNWAVLLLKAKILNELDCAFCCMNAGSAEVYNTPLRERKGKEAFLKLFDELPNGPTRKQLGIGDWYPTNPQAEILVFDRVPINYIDTIYFEDAEVFDKYRDIIVPLGIDVKVNPNPFRGRVDYKYWR